jgi:hypothetical protein
METTTNTTREIFLRPEESKATIAKATRLAERAAKKGLDGGWKVAGVESRTEKDSSGITRYYDVLTLEGTPFKYDGWSFVASVEWLEDKAYVEALPGYDGEQIDRSTLVPGWCDHCQTTRRRNTVYVVESDTGRMQVGSTCVKDYLGHDPSAVFISLPSGEPDDFLGGGYWTPATKTVEVLAVAVRIAKTIGFRSKSNAGPGQDSTATLVDQYLYGRGEYDQKFRDKIGKISPDDMAEAASIIVWIENDMTGYSDYAQNLRIAASLEVTKDKTMAILVSALAAKGYAEQRAVERAAEDAASTIVDERYAPDGEKVTIEADVKVVRHLSGAYGLYAYVTLETETHRFKWKATGQSIPEQDTRVQITGTVKGLDEWNGRISTTLTRCKFTTLEETT